MCARCPQDVVEATYRQRRSELTWPQAQLAQLEARLAAQAARFEGREAHGRYCCKALELLLSVQLTPAQAQQLLDTTWNTLTGLRRAITLALRGATMKPTSQAAARLRPSSDAMTAATESLWSQQRLTDGPAPTHEQITALALELDARRIQALGEAANGRTCDQEPSRQQQRLTNARAVLAQAQEKVSKPRFSGRAEVVVTFDKTGTFATVPSSNPAKKPYTIRLTVEGEPYACDCYQNVELARLCKHMEAARNAWWVCEQAPGLKLSARVELIPKRQPKKQTGDRSKKRKEQPPQPSKTQPDTEPRPRSQEVA